jgi:hypothetical protein
MQNTLLLAGTLLLGGWLLFEAIKSIVTGKTYYNYWGHVTREASPFKFYFLFWVRFILGAASLGLLYLSYTRLIAA